MVYRSATGELELRLMAQNVAEMISLGVSVQPRKASGGHFGDMDLTIKKFNENSIFDP